MGNELLKVASSQGVWAALSVALIFYILKAQEKRDLKQEQRESKYQNIITRLSDELNVIEEMKNDVIEIKNLILDKKIK